MISPSDLKKDKDCLIHRFQGELDECLDEDLRKISVLLKESIKNNPKARSIIVTKFEYDSWFKNKKFRVEPDGFEKSKYIKDLKQKIIDSGYKIYKIRNDDETPWDQIEIYIPV